VCESQQTLAFFPTRADFSRNCRAIAFERACRILANFQQENIDDSAAVI